jgi:hypothetical protein
VASKIESKDSIASVVELCAYLNPSIRVIGDIVEEKDDVIAGVRPREVTKTDAGGEVDKMLFVFRREGK